MPLQATPEFRRRREAVAKSQRMEARRDVFLPGLIWLAEDAKAALGAGREPLPVLAGVEAEAVPVLPSPTSLRTRTRAGHGMAVAWVGALKAGERLPHEPRDRGTPSST